MKFTVLLVTTLLAASGFSGGQDIYGNTISNSTKIGYIDGDLTTVGDLGGLYKNAGLTNGVIYIDGTNITPVVTETDPTVGLTNGTIYIDGTTMTPLTSFTETDPAVGLTNGTIYIHGSEITPLTSYSESDPVWTADSNSFETAIHAWVEGKNYTTTNAVRSLISSPDLVNTGAVVIAEAYADAGLASKVSTNDFTTAITNIAPVVYRWSSPNEWMIQFTPGSTNITAVTMSGYTDGMMILSNEVTRSVFQRNAKASAVLVDESSTIDPVVTNWTSSAGSTITSNGVITANADGSYRVTARAASGDIRYGNVILQSGTETVATNTYHAADVAGSGTKAANDGALAKLLVATKVGEYTREGSTYSVYNAQKVYITSVGAGNIKPFAVSAHILGSAAHYSWRPVGEQTFTDAEGNTATVNKLRWVNLRDWARENGWSDADIQDAGVDDIAFVICDSSTAVPDGCIPYFFNPMATLNYSDGKGLQAWQCSQFHEWAMPVTLKSWNSALVSGGYNATLYTRADVLARLKEMGNVNFCTSGDSGKPYFVVDGSGRTVVVFANKQRYLGANWVKGYSIIKAFVEAHGDTLKETN